MERSLRILQIGKYLPPVPGGMESVVYELSRGLSAQPGVHVSCLVTNTTPRTVRENLEGIDVVRAASYGSIASTPVSPVFAAEGRKMSADLFHFHLPNPLATAAFSGTKVPYVATYHCDIVRYKTLLKLYMPSFKRFLDRARKIIVSSPELIESSGVLRPLEKKCVVIPFSVETSHLEPDSRRLELASRLAREHGGRIVLFVGRLVKYKGLPHLVRAMKRVDARLIIVGNGPEEEPLRRLIRECDVSEKVHMAGYVDRRDLGAYYRAASVVALPSVNESEAFGMCLIEALACAKPLLTTDLRTGVARVNLDGVTGLKVPVGDEIAMASALTRILDEPGLAEKMGQAGRRHFQGNFQRDSMIASHLKLYSEILGA